MLQVPSISDLTTFKGKSAGYYTSFADQALLQAALLLRIRTGITEYPEDDDLELLARYAIMDLANLIYLETPYDEVLAKPFSSESIGSYSYSKSAQAARRGEQTGSMWFDLAVSELASIGGIFDVSSDSISLFEREDYYQDVDGNRFVLGPDDYNLVDNDYYYINSDRTK